MEVDTEKEILSIHDDSEDDIEMFDSDREKGEPGSESFGRTGRLGRTKVLERGKDDAGGYQEHEEGGECESPVGGRRRRGRGGYRRRGGAGGRSGQGRRGRGGTARIGEDSVTGNVRRVRKYIGRKVQFAERAYCENTNPNIKRIIKQLEEEAIQGQSESELEDWEYLLPDPGNMRGRMTLYNQSLHVYWVMKRLLVKAMEQVAVEMAELSQGIPNLKRS